MELGIFAKTFVRPHLNEVLDAVSEHGLTTVQFNFACAGLPSMPESIPQDIVDAIRKGTMQRGIRIAAMSGTFNMIHPDPAQREAGQRQLRVVAEASRELGAPLVTLCTGSRDTDHMWRAHPDNQTLEAWRDLRHSLEHAIQVAETFDLKLGLEPEPGNVMVSAKAARQLLDEMRSDRLGIVMDAANLFGPGDLSRGDAVVAEGFALLGGDIVLAHAKELAHDGAAGGLAPGAGILDWSSYLGHLRASGYDGPLIMHGFDECDTAEACRYLRATLAQFGLGT